MGVIRDSRHDEIGAVSCYHRRLCKSGAGIVLLHERMDAHYGDRETKDEIESDEESVQRAVRPSEIPVQQTSECNCERIHKAGGAD
jgi:hypothetical protein